MNEVNLNESLISEVVESNAQQKSHVDKVIQLLKDGADPNAKSVENMTSLHYASGRGHDIVAKLLLENKARVNLKSEDGSTPLHFAVKSKKNFSCVKLLLQRGAKVNSKNKKKITPLHLATAFGNCLIMKLLLKYEADVNLKSGVGALICGKGSTALHLAVKNPKSSSCVKNLLICGAEIDSRDALDFTPLHVAVKHNNIKSVKLLLDYKADVNTRERSGRTPLHTAAESRMRFSILQLLIEYGADIEAKDKKGRTSLHIAIEFNCVENVKVLLESKAEINSTNQDGLTPLHFSGEHCNPDILKLLLEHGDEPNARCAKGMTPLHNAISSVVFKDQGQWHYIEKFMELLLESKTDINSLSNDGDTPLHISVRKGTHFHSRLAEILLKYNADINVLNKEGKIPFEYISSFMEKAVRTSYETAFLHNILKRQLVHTYVNEANLKLFDLHTEFQSNSPKMMKFKLDCVDEIKRMRNVVVANGVSLYEIFTSNLNQIARYTRNEDVVQFMTLYNFRHKFPINGAMLRSQFIRGDERKSLLEQFYLYENNILPVPMECLVFIIRYLNNADFRNLIEACKAKDVALINRRQQRQLIRFKRR